MNADKHRCFYAVAAANKIMVREKRKQRKQRKQRKCTKAIEDVFVLFAFFADWYHIYIRVHLRSSVDN